MVCPLNKLKHDWLKIQESRQVPFFLTWAWISAWIQTFDPEYIVVTAEYDNEVVAIALLTYSSEYRHRWVYSKQLRLHQIGDHTMDQIWMEYNDFLCTPEHQLAATNACLKALQHEIFEWDEIVLSMMSLSRGIQVANSFEQAFLPVHRPCYAANLKAIRSSGKSYLQSLRANTRYQIRRSIRQYKRQYGELDLQQARNSDEALEFFREAGPFHMARWYDSGYKNERFVHFHENLIRSCQNQQVDLFRLRFGGNTVAIMYYHLVGKTVYFYLHGLRYDDDGKLKPGLVAHSLASQLYMENGMDVYDYMGGYSQYKLQLAERIEDLVTVCIQKPRIRFAVENLGRSVKHLLLPKR